MPRKLTKPEIVITVSPSWSRIDGPKDYVDAVMHAGLRFESKEAKDTDAYREGRTDGKAPLYVEDDPSRFPSGALDTVSSLFTASGAQVTVLDKRRRIEDYVDAKDAEGYFPDGVEPYPWQAASVRAVLNSGGRCCLRLPTNAGKTYVAAALARMFYDQCGWHTLLITSKRNLAIQTRDVFSKSIPDTRIGLFADGEKTIAPIVVACANSLFDRGKKSRHVLGYPVLIVDEAHHLGADGWYALALESKAQARIGMSGTLIVGDGLRDARVTAATGPIVYEATAREMVQAGKSSKCKIVMVKAAAASSPDLAYARKARADKYTLRVVERKYYPVWRVVNEKGIITSLPHNRAVVDAAAWIAGHGRRVLIIVRALKQVELLSRLLTKAKLTYAVVVGAKSTEERAAAKRAFLERRVQVILSSTVMDEGEDIVGINGIVLGESVKSIVPVLQRIGRGQRKDLPDVWIVDIVSQAAPVFQKHGDARQGHYVREGHEVAILDEWIPGHEHLLPFLRWREVGFEG